MATNTNSSNEYFTPENPNIESYAYRYMPKVVDENGNEKYILLFPETISENVKYRNDKKKFKTVAQALNYILSLDIDTTVDEQSPNFTVSESLIEIFKGDDISTIVGKLAKSISELKKLLNFIGGIDISAIGDGTITGAVSFLNNQFNDNYGEIEKALDTANREVI